MLGWALAITTAIALLALLLRWAARPPDTAAIATWAASYNLRLHPDEHTYVSEQLRRGRWLRTLGLVIPSMPDRSRPPRCRCSPPPAPGPPVTYWAPSPPN
jgi:hypothetical protein